MKKSTTRPASIQEPTTVRSELRTALASIAGKWKLEILWLLNQRIHRFGELRRLVPGVTQHMLTAQLRALEADGLLSRKVFAEVPPRVEYTITARGRALRPVFEAIFVWLRGRPRKKRHRQKSRR